MIWRFTIVALLLGCIATLDACTDEAASEQAGTTRAGSVPNQVARILEAERAADPLAARPRGTDEPDPCAGVSEAAVMRVEAQMQDLNGELVALGAEEMQALTCSRSRLDR